MTSPTGDVSAAAVGVTWSHVSVAEAVLVDGMRPRAAFDAACHAWFLWALPRFMFRIQPRDVHRYGAMCALPQFGGTFPEDSLVHVGSKRRTTRCFVESAAQNERIMLKGGGHLLPRVSLDPAIRLTLGWQLAMMRVFATGGGSLPRAARIALDRRDGRPRRKRSPVDPGWLAGQLTAALDAAWDALCTTRYSSCPCIRIYGDAEMPGGSCVCGQVYGGLPATRPRIALMDPTLYCQCGAPYFDDHLGRLAHSFAYNHKPERG